MLATITDAPVSPARAGASAANPGPPRRTQAPSGQEAGASLRARGAGGIAPGPTARRRPFRPAFPEQLPPFRDQGPRIAGAPKGVSPRSERVGPKEKGSNTGAWWAPETPGTKRRAGGPVRSRDGKSEGGNRGRANPMVPPSKGAGTPRHIPGCGRVHTQFSRHRGGGVFPPLTRGGENPPRVAPQRDEGLFVAPRGHFQEGK